MRSIRRLAGVGLTSLAMVGVFAGQAAATDPNWSPVPLVTAADAGEKSEAAGAVDAEMAPRDPNWG